MFDIMSDQIPGLGFGSCGDNGRILQVDNLCGFKDCCFCRVHYLRSKEIGNDTKVGKCLRGVLCQISFCFFQDEITNCEGNTSCKTFEQYPACRAGCGKCGGIEHTAIKKHALWGVR